MIMSEKDKNDLSLKIILPDLYSSLLNLGKITSNLIFNLFNEIPSIVPKLIKQDLIQIIDRNKKFIADISKLESEEYDDYFKERLNIANELGQCGWTISPHMPMGNEKNAIRYIKKHNEEKKLTKYFIISKKCENKIIENLSIKYNSKSLSMYYNDFLMHYKKHDYTTSAFYLCSIFEVRLKLLFKNDEFRKNKNICTKSINKRRKNYFEQNKKKLSTIIMVIDYLPSLQKFAERLLTEDKIYDLDTGVEPKYLNRNWLMHGQMTRKVEKYEIQQLLNALSTLEHINEEFVLQEKPNEIQI